MANLLVRNIDDAIAEALTQRARQHGISAEAEHRRILERALLQPRRRSFSQLLAAMPDVGRDEDFERRQDDGTRNTRDFQSTGVRLLNPFSA